MDFSIYSDQTWNHRRQSCHISTNESKISYKHSISAMSEFCLSDKFAFCLLVMFSLNQWVVVITKDSLLYLSQISHSFLFLLTYVSKIFLYLQLTFLVFFFLIYLLSWDSFSKITEWGLKPYYIREFKWKAILLYMPWRKSMRLSFTSSTFITFVLNFSVSILSIVKKIIKIEN